MSSTTAAPPSTPDPNTASPPPSSSNASSSQLPRVAISYCTQCKWLLRAAYYAQELLSTFGASIGEVALIPTSGGTFQVHVTYDTSISSSVNDNTTKSPEDKNNHHHESSTSAQCESSSTEPMQTVMIWDRKQEGGFPETKILKQKLRNLIAPGRGLGHVDTPSSSSSTASTAGAAPSASTVFTPASSTAASAIGARDKEISKTTDQETGKKESGSSAAVDGKECEDCQ